MGHWKVYSFLLLVVFVFTTHWFSLVNANVSHDPGGQVKQKSKSSAGSFLNLFRNCLVRLSASGNKLGTPSASIIGRYSKYFSDKTSVIIETIERSVTNSSSSFVLHSRTRQGRNVEENETISHGTGVSKNKRRRWRMMRKNLDCFAQIYFVDGIVGENGDFLWVHKILEELVVHNENPSHIIFIKNYHNNKEKKRSSMLTESEKGFYSNLYRLSLTAKFIVIDGGRKVIQMVCLHCRGDIENQLKWIDPERSMNSLGQLNHFWEKIHQNLLERVVEGTLTKGRALDELTAFEQHGCGLYKAGLKTVENICAQLAISKSLNFTPFTTTKDFRIYGHIKSGVLSYSGYNDQLFLKPSATARYEWATTAEYFEPFIYITVVNKDALNISALWRVFDLQTWMTILTIFVVLAGIFASITSSRFEVIQSRLNHLRFTFVLFTAILLEQCQLTIWKVRMRINMLSKIILVVWILISVIISSLYKGTIFSYLATSIPPPIPPTTKALVESSYFLLTSTNYYYQGKSYSTLDGILNEMTVGQAGRDYPLFYKELKEKVHFVTAGFAEIVKAHKTSSQLLIINTHQNGRNNNYDDDDSTRTTDNKQEKEMLLVQNVTLPHDFAIIGSQFDTETLMKLLETFTTSFVLKSSTVNIFLNRLPFIIKRNFFFNKFQPALSHLYESGIYENWRKMTETGHVVREFENVHQTVGRGIEEPNNYNYLALLFSGMKIIEGHYTNPTKPLSFEIFDSAFVFYVICSAGSMSVFLTEWFFFIFCKFFLKIDRNMVGHQRI